jgi:Tol biopolymer transport system component
MQLAELQSGASEKTSGVSDDGLSIVYCVQTGDIQDLERSKRTSTAEPFDPPDAVSELNTPTFNECYPWLSGDGTRLLFASDREGKGSDIFEVTRADSTSPFGAPVELSDIDSNEGDRKASLSADGLDIYFSSNRPGGNGGYDIYTSHRDAIGEAFSTPTIVMELSSTMDDDGARLSRDGATMYLNYNSDTLGGQNASLDVATRECQR